jgi:uncharacterized protein
MLFRRRNPASWQETLRIALWPRRSWLRSSKYVAKRILRLTASPHAIAAGVAAGVFASFTPFLGVHFIIAFTVSYVIAGNFLAAALGTFFGNPLTFPFIWASTYAAGRSIMSGSTAHLTFDDPQHARLLEIAPTDLYSLGYSVVLEKILGLWEPVVKPMTIGAVPLGIVAGIVAYMLTRWIAVGFRAARKKRLTAKAAAQRQAQLPPAAALPVETAPETTGAMAYSGGAGRLTGQEDQSPGALADGESGYETASAATPLRLPGRAGDPIDEPAR